MMDGKIVGVIDDRQEIDSLANGSEFSMENTADMPAAAQPGDILSPLRNAAGARLTVA
jgi:hypothetical protein